MGGGEKKFLPHVDGVPGPIECQAICSVTDDCAYFSWRTHDDLRCHLLEYHPDLTYNGQNENLLVSGPKECPDHAWTTVPDTTQGTTDTSK